MGKINLVSRKIVVDQTFETKSFNCSINYKHEPGSTPDLIVIVAQTKKDEKLSINLLLYPSTNNLQMVVKNKPDDFDASVINEILPYFKQIISEAGTAPVSEDK